MAWVILVSNLLSTIDTYIYEMCAYMVNFVVQFYVI